MSHFEMSFSTENAAFEGDPVDEVVRILKATASKLERGSRSGKVMDANGNGVGAYLLAEYEEAHAE